MAAHDCVVWHQENPSFRLRQVPQLSVVAQQAGIWTHELVLAHHEYPGVRQIQFPQGSKLFGQFMGIRRQVLVSGQNVNPMTRLKQLPQSSEVLQQVGIFTQLLVRGHQL